MRILLIGLILFMTLSQAFNFDPGPAPGLRIRNALVYLLLLGLLLRFATDRYFRLQQAAVPVVYSVLIGYALFTYVLILLVIDYPRYDAVLSGMILKSSLIDQLLSFLVFFYGCRSDKDAMLMLKVLFGCWAAAHVFAVLDAIGLVHVGDIERDETGRVQGAIGEPNQYGAFVASSLPAILALMATAKSMWQRLFWASAAAAATAALILTISRGAYLATMLAGIAGLILFRRSLPTRKLAMWVLAAVVGLVMIVGVIVALGFGDQLYERVFGQLQSGGWGQASSGRTEVWSTIMGIMFQQPITLLTGFGWYAYQTLPLRFATHNHYLELWFNLGLPGLVCGILLFVLPIRIALKALRRAGPAEWPMLASFVLGCIAMAIAVFFVNLYSPWIYWYCYVGVMMRLAQNALDRPLPAPVVAPAQAVAARDAHGWSGAAARSLRGGALSR
jgi:O-antigen ligase